MCRPIVRSVWSAAAALLVGAVPLASAAQEATPTSVEVEAEVEVVAAGLTNPRGFTWGENGDLYVAIAGVGGPNLPTEQAPAIEAYLGYFGGPSARIERIVEGCSEIVAEGLPSYIDGTGAVVGVSDVAFLDGQLYATVDGGGAVHGNPDQPAGLYRINEDGSYGVVADLSAWFRDNPVAEPPTADFDTDGEVWQMVPAAAGDAFWVVESNQGQLLRITLDGDIERVADLSEGHAVPTGIAPADDGGVYVADLTPVPFPDGAAKVVHVAPDGTVTDHWNGLTAVVALAVGPDGALYALEMATDNLDEDPFILPGTGRVVRQTGLDSMEVVADGMDFPIGLDVGPDGALYVSTPALGADDGGGTILRLDPVTDPVSLADAALDAPSC